MVLTVEMLEYPGKFACFDQEQRFGFDEARLVPRKIRPIWLLPVPIHER